MELSMNTNSKMRTRCQIPYACWERKIEAQREGSGGTGQMEAQKAGQKERDGERRKKEEVKDGRGGMERRGGRGRVASLGTCCQTSPGM